METKFTKGNWMASKYSPCDYGVHSDEGKGNDIALVRGNHSDEEVMANAKLIESAPDLLTALNDLVNHLGDEWVNDKIVLAAKRIIHYVTN